MLSPRPIAHRFAAAVLALALIDAGCAASSALRRGREAEHRQDNDAAVVEFTKAARLRPNDTEAMIALDRAKLRASQDHFTRGRRLAATGKLDQALVEYELAAELNPSSAEVDEALRATRALQRAKIAVPREGKTQLESLIERTRNLPPPGLDLPQGV
jgi:tetratricopeptide (TPR) repeat protein